MLPVQHRLRLEKDIKTLFAKGKGVFDMDMGLKFRPNRLEYSRFAVVVGSKVSKKAVVRNRIRRRIRGGIREMLPQIKPGYDVIVMTRPGIQKKEFGDLQGQLERLFKKGHLLG